VINRIEQIPEYVSEFERAFGALNSVSIENAVSAIAAFERTLITPESNLDKFLSGEPTAMNTLSVSGMKLFESVGCIECHSGPALNGWAEHSSITELVEFPRFPESQYVQRYDLASDKGRHAVTGEPADEHLFKTPILRNITLTAPYLHNGKVPSLEEACRVMASSQLDMELTDDEVSQLVAFMTELEGEFPSLTLPRLPSRSGNSVIDTFKSDRQ
jgi:cytochrome c peroxidase